ncbi:hypothetical protein ABIB90_004790 [Bradyrhizobium sp. JR4.1]
MQALRTLAGLRVCLSAHDLCEPSQTLRAFAAAAAAANLHGVAHFWTAPSSRFLPSTANNRLRDKFDRLAGGATPTRAVGPP